MDSDESNGITEWFGWNSTYISFHSTPCHGHRYLPPSQVSSSLIQPALDNSRDGSCLSPSEISSLALFLVVLFTINTGFVAIKKSINSFYKLFLSCTWSNGLDQHIEKRQIGETQEKYFPLMLKGCSII